MVGASPSAIGYPNVRSCIGITAVLSNGWMVGAHAAKTDSAGFLCDGIWECIRLINSQSGMTRGTVDFLCLTGNLTQHPGGDPRSEYRDKFDNSPQKDSGALPGAVDLKVYNTRSVYKATGEEGVFVLVTYQGAGRMPLLQYKNHGKMDYVGQNLGQGNYVKATVDRGGYTRLPRFDSNGFWYCVPGAAAYASVAAFRKGQSAPSSGVNVPVMHTAKFKS